MTPIEPVGRPFQVVMLWGGLRGAVTLALALSLPTSLGYWWTIQSIAFGVVLFTTVYTSHQHGAPVASLWLE